MSKKQCCIYVNTDEWNQFMEICKREKDAASGKIGQFIHQYNLQHGHGNPQLTINRFVKIENLPILRIPNVVCDFIVGVTKDRQILCKKRGSDYHSQKACAACEHNRLKEPYG